MKMHDNTLYITTQGAYISKDGENLSIRLNDETRRQFPVHTLGGLVCFGNVSLSPFALGLCGQSGVTVSMLTEQGRFLARMEGPISGNVLLRRAQYRAPSPPRRAPRLPRHSSSLKWPMPAPSCFAPSETSPSLPRRSAWPPSDWPPRLGRSRQSTTSTPSVAQEGEAAVSYFDAFDHLITSQKADFRFQGRSRGRPELRQRHAFVPLGDTDPRRPCRLRNRRPGSAGRIPAPQPSGPSKPGPGSHGGVPPGAGRSAGVFANQPKAGRARWLPPDGVGRGRDGRQERARLCSPPGRLERPTN